jgi:hypothetical protein
MSREAEAFLRWQRSLAPAHAPARPAVSVQALRALELAMDQSGQCIDLPVQNHFSAGVYARELHIPAGTVLTGRTHRKENLNILTSGDISVLVDGHIRRISAPATIVSPAGTKRVAYAHTACTWITVHGTDLTDLQQIEKEFLEPEPMTDIANSLDRHVAQAMLAAVLAEAR